VKRSLIEAPQDPTFKIPRYFELRRRAFFRITGHLVTQCGAKLGAVVCVRQSQFSRKKKNSRIHNFNPLKFYVYLDYFKDVGPKKLQGRYFLYDIENPVDDFEGELRAANNLLTSNPDFRFTGVWLKEKEFAQNFRVVVEPADIVLKRRKKVVATAKYVVAE
jgi:hypothetical protein